MFPQCYVCGSDNPAGLHVSFHRLPDGSCRADYVARPEHVGWPDTIHGGLLFTLMDEAVAWSMIYGGLRGVTAKAEIRFRAPAKVGVPLVISARITEPPRRTVKAHAEIRADSAEGPVLAELDAVMVVNGVLEGV